MHASLRMFYSQEPPSDADLDIKASTYAFGLIALGKFTMRLPAEVAEDELPRLKGTLIGVSLKYMADRHRADSSPLKGA